MLEQRRGEVVPELSFELYNPIVSLLIWYILLSVILFSRTYSWDLRFPTESAFSEGVAMAYKEIQLTKGLDFPVDIFVQDNHILPILVAPHWHDCSEILYMLCGESMQTVEGRGFLMNEGDLLVLHEGVVHGTQCRPGEDVRILVVKFLPSLLSGSFSHFADTRYALAFLNRCTDAPIRIPEEEEDRDWKAGPVSLHVVLLALLDEFASKREGYELAVKGWIEILAARLARNGAIGTGTGNSGKTLDGRLNAVFRFVEAHYADPVHLQDAAREAGMSESAFSRWFHRHTDRTFKAYLDFVRVCEVERRLLLGNSSISEAAYSCGFGNIPAFNRVFRRVRGYSPSDMKRSISAKNAT